MQRKYCLKFSHFVLTLLTLCATITASGSLMDNVKHLCNSLSLSSYERKISVDIHYVYIIIYLKYLKVNLNLLLL